MGAAREVTPLLAEALTAGSLADAAERIVAGAEGLAIAIGVLGQDGWRALSSTDHEPLALLDGDDGVRITDVAREDGRTVRLAARTGDPDADAHAALCALFLRAAVDRLDAVEQAARAERRLVDNERIGRIGSYDWNILTDTNEWSDELYRIYGHEPQSFNASYDRFIEMIHPDDRETIKAIHARAYETGEPYEMEERIVRPDGELRLLWSNGEVIRDEDGTPLRMIGVCRDVTEQRRAEETARRAAEHVAEVEVRRRQAMELNDNVVQGLVTLLWQLDLDEDAAARDTAERTLQAARAIMDDLLSDGDTVAAGSLVRRTPSGTEPTAVAPTDVGPVAPMTAPGVRRVLIADDTADIRLLVRLRLQRSEGIVVVGEASDGEEVLRMVEELRPDVVVLDLAMPRIDGLDATERLRASHPGLGIVVHSGYSESSMLERVLAAGADAYVEKQADLHRLVDRIREVAAAVDASDA